MPNDDLSGKQMDHVSLSGANLADANLSQSSFRHAQLKGTNLQHANLDGSDLRGAHMEGADITGASLRDTDLSDASLHGVDLGRAARMDGITLTGAKGVSDALLAQAAVDRVISVRWEGDTRGTGVGDGRAIIPEVQRLLDALAAPTWVTESPEVHLLPPLRAASEAASPWTLDATEEHADAYVVRVSWGCRVPTMRQLRADAFALIGAIAESVTFVGQRRTEKGVEYRIVTGMVGEEGGFAAHGHLLLLRVGGPAVERLLARG